VCRVTLLLHEEPIFVNGSLVTTAWCVLRLRIEVATNIMNKQTRTADKGWSSSLGVGRVATRSLGPVRILLINDLSERKWI
jgi:hypothetical protein